MIRQTLLILRPLGQLSTQTQSGGPARPKPRLKIIHFPATPKLSNCHLWSRQIAADKTTTSWLMSCLLPSCSTFYNNTENICISATALLQQTLNFKYSQVCVEQTFRWSSGAEHGPFGKLPAGNMRKHRNVRQSGLNQTFHWTHKANRDHWKCSTEPCLLILTNLFTLNIYCHSAFKYGLRSDVRPYVLDVTTRGRAVGHALKLGKCLLWRERQRDDKEPTQPVLHCWPVDWKNKKKWETDGVQTRAAPRRSRETQGVYKRPACLRKIVW